MKEGTFEYIEQKIHRDANGTSFGGDFEWLVKHFLENYAPYKSIYKEVYFPSEKDLGNDLIGKKYSGGLTAIQCKGFAPHRTIYKYHIDSFLNESSNPIYEDRMLVTTTDRLGRNTLESIKRHSKPVLRILRSDLLTADFVWPHQIGAAPLPRKTWTPKPYQPVMIEEILNGFQKYDRGRMIAACALGKTYISFKVGEKLNSRLILILVPTISLVAQTVADWQNYSEEPIDILAVCSDETMGRSQEDEFLYNETVASLGPMKVTENPQVIRQFIEARRNNRAVVVVCYPSSDKIAAAQKNSKVHFDFAIADEAHNTTSSGVASTILYSSVKAQKRLFMTATPRLYTERVVELSKKNNARVHSMDDEELYGPVFCLRTFGWAIRQGWIADYRVVGMEVTENEIRGIEESVEQSIRNRKRVTADGKVKTDMLSLGTEMVTAKVAKIYNCEKILTCHARVKQALKFTESFPLVYKRLSNSKPLHCSYVTGEMTGEVRKAILQQFSSFQGVSTASHCQALSEGVNSPYMDMIVFCSPKQSVQDIVQNIGRGLRKPDAKPKTTTIVIPILIQKNEKGELELDESAYAMIGNVVRALRSYDAEFSERCGNILLNAGSTGSVTALPEKVKIIQSPDVSINDVKRAIFHHDITAQIVKSGADRFLQFQQARAFVHSLTLKNYGEWKEYTASGSKPDNIPADPNHVYKNKGWKGFGDWLGTWTVATHLREYRPFEEAKAFIHILKLKGQSDWVLYCKSGKKPKDIPNAPWQVYSDDWKNFGDWLGTGRIATFLRKYRSFKEARKFVHSLELKGQKDWAKYRSSGNKPSNIPSNPHQVYEKQGWKGYGDWLGTGNIASRFRKYLPFKEARAIVQGLKLKNQNEWRNYSKLKRPINIPGNPGKVYKNKGWKNWGDWLGSRRIASQLVIFLPFRKARKLIQSLKFKNIVEWKQYSRTKRPPNIPGNPNTVYKNSGWKGFGDWLGTGNVRTKEFRSFEEARTFVRTLKLKSAGQWREYIKSGKKPNNIPSNPERIYKDRWRDWGDWLGAVYRKYLSFEESRDFAHSLELVNGTQWKEFVRSGNKPENIPNCPNSVYKNKGWKGWIDFLGASNVSKFRPFEDARTYIRSLKLKNLKDWADYLKSGKKPDDIPSSPSQVYKDVGWKNLGDWLGTGNVASWLRQYIPFDEARSIVQKENLKNKNDWDKYCDSGKKPAGIPYAPHLTYRSKGWKGWGHFLGTGFVATQDRKYLPYIKAQAFVGSLRLGGQKEWNKYCNSGRKPADIPRAANVIYENKGWTNWGDWLGTGSVSTSSVNYLTFEKARSFVHTIGIKSQSDWNKYCHSGRKPLNIPRNAQRTYKNEGWKSWGDWLGTDYVADQLKDYLPFEEARSYVRSLGLKTWGEWKEFCRSGKKPSKIPSRAWRTYKNKGWKNMGDWLGTGKISNNRQYLSFSKARKFVRSLKLKNGDQWRYYSKTNRPPNIPGNPNKVYENKGWKGIKDWLGIP